MALSATIESLDGLNESLHEHYEQDGDVYRLRVEGYEDEGLRTVLEDKKRAVKRLREQLSAYEGIDPDEVAELRTLRDEYETKIATAGSWEENKTRLEAKYQKTIDTANAERDAFGGQLSNLLGENAARSALSDAGAIVSALLPHVLSRTSVVTDDDGKRRAVATGLDGETETDIPGLVAEMKGSGEQFDWGFRPNGNSGAGGAAGSGGGSAGKVRSKDDLKSAAEHSGFIAEHGLKAYQELPRAS